MIKMPCFLVSHAATQTFQDAAFLFDSKDTLTLSRLSYIPKSPSSMAYMQQARDRSQKYWMSQKRK